MVYTQGAYYVNNFLHLLDPVFLYNHQGSSFLKVMILKGSAGTGIGSIIRKISVLVVFFSVLYFILYGFSYLEKRISCFPVTVITTDKTATDKIFDSMEICSISVAVEKMTFDSAVFNHYEKLPVKDIYLYSVEIPYLQWESVKKIDDAISEANPYIEDIIEDYVHSRIKYQSIAFIFLFFAGLLFLFKAAPSWKINRKQFLTTSVSVIMTYLILSFFVFSSFQWNLYPLISITLSILFSIYLIILIIIWRLMKNPEAK